MQESFNLKRTGFWTFQVLGWSGYFLFATLSATSVFPFWLSASVNGSFILMALGLSSVFHLLSKSERVKKISISTYAALGLLYFTICSALLMVIINSFLFPLAMDMPITDENWTVLFRGTLKYSFMLWAWFGFYLAGRFWKNYVYLKEIPSSFTLPISEGGKESPQKKEAQTPLSLDNSIFLNESFKTDFIRVKEITHINAEGAYSRVFVGNGKNYLFTKTLKDWEKQLDSSSFIRVHRSHIINVLSIKQVKKLGNNTFKILLENVEKPIPMSRRFGAELSFK